MTDPYLLLGLPTAATADEVRTAWKRVARETHPDRNPDDPSANHRFSAAREAYETLSDLDARARYDRERLAEQTIGRMKAEPYTAPGWRPTAEPPPPDPAWWRDMWSPGYQQPVERVRPRGRTSSRIDHVIEEELQQEILEDAYGNRFVYNRFGVPSRPVARARNPFRSFLRNGGRFG